MAAKNKTRNKPRATAKLRARQPIADKVINKLRGYVNAKVVDLSAVVEGKDNAQTLQRTVATREELAEYHPAHAFYVHAQNQASVLAEQLSMLPETDRFTRLIGPAEDEYAPIGPPMSPLTQSFFTCWSLFDACVGLGHETLGTTSIAVGKALGMHEDLLRVLGLMQASHMAVYRREGSDGDLIVLREMVTNRVCPAVCPAGLAGRAGQLWYARVLPPPVIGHDEHVVFTTPYVLVEPGEREWQAYFDRTLPDGPPDKRLAAYAKHMKWGPARNYWSEFVFEAYDSHQSDAIFLCGLPDVAKSRPHAKVNWD